MIQSANWGKIRTFACAAKRNNKNMVNYKIEEASVALPENLRDHPRMSFNGAPNWPPEWMWADGPRNFYLHPTGEVGVLEDVRRSMMNPDRCLFVTMRRQEVSISDVSISIRKEFCKRVFELLRANHSRTIQEIGAIDISN